MHSARQRGHRELPSPKSAASSPAVPRRNSATNTAERSNSRVPRSAISDRPETKTGPTETRRVVRSGGGSVESAASVRALMRRLAFCGVAPRRCFWQCPRRFGSAVRPLRRGEGLPARFQRTGVEFMTALWGIIACGVLAIVYGIWAIQSVMAADAGSQKMQEISAATREGAQAYLKRQYATIAAAGIIIFVILGLLLGWLVAIGFAIGAVLSGAAGFIGMNVSVRANVRTAQAAIGSLAGGLEIAFKSGAITGMFVAGLALLGVTVYFAV